jgi:hypothetical protein
MFGNCDHVQRIFRSLSGIAIPASSLAVIFGLVLYSAYLSSLEADGPAAAA